MIPNIYPTRNEAALANASPLSRQLVTAYLIKHGDKLPHLTIAEEIMIARICRAFYTCTAIWAARSKQREVLYNVHLCVKHHELKLDAFIKDMLIGIYGVIVYIVRNEFPSGCIMHLHIV